MEDIVKEDEIKAQQPSNYFKLPKWLAVMAVLIVLIVIVSGVFIFGIMLGKNQNNNVSKSTTQKVVLVTPTAAPVVSVAPTKTVPNFQVSTNSNLLRFTSEKLGISFTYLKSQNGQTISAKEIGTKIYVYFDNTQPTSGQYIEVIDKNTDQTLEQAIKFLILNGYSDTNCTLKPETQYVPAGFDALSIVIPFNDNDTMETIQAKAEKCPAGYTANGGMAYFIENPSHPDKMYFLSIGQYLINSEGENKGWQDTIQVF